MTPKRLTGKYFNVFKSLSPWRSDRDSSCWDGHSSCNCSIPTSFVASIIFIVSDRNYKGIMRISDQVLCVMRPGVPGNCLDSSQQSVKESGPGVARSQDEPPCLQDAPDLSTCPGGEECPGQSS